MDAHPCGSVLAASIHHHPKEEVMATKRFEVGDHVRWNSEAGHVSGHITRVVTSPERFKSYTVHASEEEPQYEIRSDRTDHVAMHKGSALTKIAD
jgi:hypothetical protein